MVGPSNQNSNSRMIVPRGSDGRDSSRLNTSRPHHVRNSYSGTYRNNNNNNNNNNAVTGGGSSSPSPRAAPVSPLGSGPGQSTSLRGDRPNLVLGIRNESEEVQNE